MPQELNIVNVHQDFNTIRSLSLFVIGLERYPVNVAVPSKQVSVPHFKTHP